MGPPPPPSSQRLRDSTSSIAIQGSNADISQPGTTAEVPIDFTDAEESQSSASSTSTHKRKDNSPAAALEAASIAWKRAQKTAADQKAAAEEGVEWQPGPGKTASTVYLNYGPPTLSKDKAGKAVIAFPCLCCTPSVEVVRPCSESSTSNLRTHIFRQQNKRSQTTIPAMLASQRPTAASDTISLLPFSVTRQMSVAWVAESGRPLSIIEDKGFLAFLPKAQQELMPGRFTIARDITRVFCGMQKILTSHFDDVKGCFHLAVDVWTSANGFAFLGLIICYQQSGKAVRRLLEMVPFLTQHDEQHLASATFKVLDKYKIAGRLWSLERGQ
ncbi:unnamed protein product [Tilletia controversa]|nr:unnamed protein product [Tilletia controversa]CAD7064636.1 unnamed protein product [Tilletia caries]